MGIAIVMLIGLWVHDEWSYNKHHEHYESIAIVLQHNPNGKILKISQALSKRCNELLDSIG